MQTLTAMIYSNLGGNYFQLTNTSYPLNFVVPSNFTSNCFYDSAKTIKDKIQLVPSLVQVSITNPYYVNLTSPTNWEYDWNTSTVSVPFNVKVSTYVSNALYVVVKVLGVCPNSYMFTANNFSVSASAKNWLRIERSTVGYSSSRLIELTTPWTNHSLLLVGISLNGIVLQDNAISKLFLSVNLTASVDVMNQ